MCRHAVRDWLVQLTMEKYMLRMADRGYDTIAMCKLLTPFDLLQMNITDESHRKLLMDGVHMLRNSAEQFICSEPCELHGDELNMDLFKTAEDDELDARVSFYAIVLNADISAGEDWSADSISIESSLPPSPPPTSRSTSLPKFECKQLISKSTQPTLSKSKSWPKFERMQWSEHYEPSFKSMASEMHSPKANAGYICSACPHLKFPTASALEEHVADESNGAEPIEHEKGEPLVEYFEKLVIEEIDSD
ncbi:uncharacterized protein LOC115621608 [Scaptodrosophila lebanonensis]|uniref:Uncharacterized protein LOC115621608 n=1 Tax=Drosophila lebanonensis TaxID=7225 RepID=A0A6J2T2L5_DROLE|nr:uncharacterized protein LOC115621608 [Scaptodrosophila lebanonensis]